MKSKFWKFGGSALLALAITAIPALSHADTIDSGTFVSGTISPTSNPMAGDIMTVKIVGSSATFTMVTGPLVASPFPGVFFLTGGSVDITNSMLGTFADALTGGSFSLGGVGSFTAGGFLVPIPGLTTGSTTFNFTVENGGIVGGSAGLNFVGTIAFIPEPGTLGLMGTGLIGLAGLLKRKLNLS